MDESVSVNQPLCLHKFWHIDFAQVNSSLSHISHIGPFSLNSALRSPLSSNWSGCGHRKCTTTRFYASGEPIGSKQWEQLSAECESSRWNCWAQSPRLVQSCDGRLPWCGYHWLFFLMDGHFLLSFIAISKNLFSLFVALP